RPRVGLLDRSNGDRTVLEIIAIDDLEAARVDPRAPQDDEDLLRAEIAHLLRRALGADAEAHLLDVAIGAHRRRHLFEGLARFGLELLVVGVELDRRIDHELRAAEARVERAAVGRGARLALALIERIGDAV